VGNETEFSCAVSACNLKKQRGLLPRGLPAAGRCVDLEYYLSDGDPRQSARRSMSDGGQSAADIAAARVECGERVGDVRRGVDAECR
jgi:hypothetical protein